MKSLSEKEINPLQSIEQWEDEVLNRYGQREDLGRPSAPLAYGGGEQPETGPQTVGDHGDQTAAPDDEYRGLPPPRPPDFQTHVLLLKPS